MMAMERSLGRFLILTGLAVAAAGVLVLFAGRVPWIGRLPGDLRFHRGGVSFYFPLATCIVFSIVLSLLLRLFLRR
jgi:hypothetical protein